ncbi:MAG: O-antigen ligase family protein [Thermodesulfobacteriota bacterium]|nr:O-antigen ligase family protein [Thermodesulfobacteriota bacterium]
MVNISRIFFWGLLIFAPLAFGSVESWALFLLILFCGASLVIYLLECWRGNQHLYRVPGLVPLLCIAGFMVLQVLPLPAGILRFISPNTLDIWQSTAGLFADATAWPLSLSLKGTIVETARFFLCFGGYVLAVQLLSERTMFKRTLLIMACFGGVFAFFAIVQSIFTTDHALWFRYVPVNAMVFGSYVCHNHYAGLMEMLIPVSLALAIAHRPLRQFGPFKEKLIGFFEERKTPVFLLLCFCTVIMVVSVFASLSRGGMVSMCASLVIFGVALVINRRTRRVVIGRKGVALFAMIVLLGVSWFGWSRIDLRFGELPVLPTDEHSISRLNYWRDSLALLRAFPVAGTGMGSFQTVFPAYQSFFSADTVIAHAHNDYLELLAEGGLTGGGLFLVLLTVILVTTRNRLKIRRDRFSILICLGAGAGITAILIHGLVDFNLRIVANAFYFSIFFALMVTAAHTRLRKKISFTYLPVCSNRTIAVTLIGVLSVWGALLTLMAGIWTGEARTAFLKHQSIVPDTPAPVLNHIASVAARAAAVDPLDETYQIIRGDARLFAGDAEGAAIDYQKAVCRVPTKSEALQKAGLAMAYASTDMALADALMAAGVQFSPMKLQVYKQYAAFLFAADRRESAFNVVSRAIITAPDKSGEFFDFMRAAGVSPLEMIPMLPEDDGVYYRMALFLRKTGHNGLYVPMLEKALEMSADQPDPPMGIFHRLANAHERNNDIDAAISVLEKGVDYYPDHIPLLYKLARLYEKSGITFKAQHLYQMIFYQDPAYRDVRQRLVATGG